MLLRYGTRTLFSVLCIKRESCIDLLTAHVLYWRDKYPLHGSACHWSGAPYSSRKTPDTLNQRPPAALTGPWIPKRPWRWAQYCRIGAQQNVPRGAGVLCWHQACCPVWALICRRWAYRGSTSAAISGTDDTCTPYFFTSINNVFLRCSSSTAYIR